MKCCYSRLLCIVLTFVLSGILVPVSLLAQAPAGNEQAQPQDQTPTQDQQQDRQQQEDKASQEIINRNHLPDAPSANKPQIQEETTPAAQAAPKAPVVEPSGTAAAQAGKISGSAGSRPAGAAIAPAKQRQVRSLVIKLGAIAGAGIALGTVAALSKATSPKPPGAQ
jgi:cytoskeletal protein RodZ